MNSLRTPTLTLAIAGMLTLALTGCTAPASDSPPTTSDDPAAAESTNDESTTEDSADDSGQIVVIGGDLASSTALQLAETYAEGQDPQPSVEFLDATTVRFAFPDGADELGNCQIAYGVMSGEGVRVLIAVGANELDCNAEIEG